MGACNSTEFAQIPGAVKFFPRRGWAAGKQDNGISARGNNQVAVAKFYTLYSMNCHLASVDWRIGGMAGSSISRDKAE
jgi:hypothetical protein